MTYFALVNKSGKSTLISKSEVLGVTYRSGYRFNNKLVSDDLENKTGKSHTVRAKLGVMLAAGGFSRR